jgi:hypothetical protein
MIDKSAIDVEGYLSRRVCYKIYQKLFESSLAGIKWRLFDACSNYFSHEYFLAIEKEIYNV